MIRRSISLKRKVILIIFSIFIFFLSYDLWSKYEHHLDSENNAVPSFKQIWSGVDGSGGANVAFKIDDFTGNRVITSDIIATGYRFFIGIFIGIFSAVLLGLLMGCFESWRAFFNWPISFLAKIPPTASMALFFVLVGFGMKMYISIIIFGIIPIFAKSLSLAIEKIPDENIYKAKTLGASKLEQIWNVIFAQMLPVVIDTIRLQIGPAMVYLIAAEMRLGDVGFGYTIRMAWRDNNMGLIYFYLFLLGCFGYFLELILQGYVRCFFKWYRDEGR